jgi:hypothetical protein
MSSSSFTLLSKRFVFKAGITQGLCQSVREAKKRENVFEPILERVGRAQADYPILLGG